MQGDETPDTPEAPPEVPESIPDTPEAPPEAPESAPEVPVGEHGQSQDSGGADETDQQQDD